MSIIPLKERSILARERVGLTQLQAAKRIGCSRATIAMWEADGTRSISGRYLMQAATVYKVRPDWLSLETEEDGYPWVGMSGSANISVTAEANMRVIRGRPIVPYDSPEDLPAGTYVSLPRLEYRLSAGRGGPDPDAAELAGTGAAFRSDFIRAQGWSPKTHYTMRCDGESMEPTIQDGAPVVIACNETTIRSGRIYALLLNDEPLLKRLHKRPGGLVQVTSDNPMPQYAAYEVEESALTVIGRAVWTPMML